MAANFSVVSRGEIITGIRQAKNPKAQKKIFAELCCCSVAEIEKIIQEDKQMKYWSEKDIAILQELCEEGKSRSEIAEFFERDEKSVENKIYDLRRKGIIIDKSKNDVKFQDVKSLNKKTKKPSSTPPISCRESDASTLLRNESDAAFFRGRCEMLEKELAAKNAENLKLQKENSAMQVVLDVIERIVKT